MEPKSLFQIISEEEFLKIVQEPCELFFMVGNDFTNIVAGNDDVSEQLLDQLGVAPGIVFDCVGLPGTLQMAIDYAAPSARIIVVGLCMQSDNYFPAKALLKELDVCFSYVYSKEDFKKVINLIGEKRIDPAQLISRRVSLNEFPTTFQGLKKPGSDLKVMMEPSEICVTA